MNELNAKLALLDALKITLTEVERQIDWWTKEHTMACNDLVEYENEHREDFDTKEDMESEWSWEYRNENVRNAHDHVIAYEDIRKNLEKLI